MGAPIDARGWRLLLEKVKSRLAQKAREEKEEEEEEEREGEKEGNKDTAMAMETETAPRTAMESPQERYAVWKKNSPLLYRQLQTSSLLWPSLTLDWLPDTTTPQSGDTTYAQHRLVLSTFSNGASPLEAVLLTRLNLLDLDSDACRHLENYDYSAATGEFTYSLATPHLDNTAELTQTATAGEQGPAPGETSTEQEHAGEAVISTSTSTGGGDDVKTQRATVNNSLGLIQRIPHPGDVHRVKHCPHNPDLLATASDSGAVRIFDRTRKPNNYNDADFQHDDTDSSTGRLETSDILLQYHTSESWTLDWNPQSRYTIATASDDGSIAVWNLDTQFKAPPRQKFSTLDSKFRFSTCTLTSPHHTIPAHNYGVNEVRWIPDHHSLLVSAGEDGACRLWDLRCTDVSGTSASIEFPPSAEKPDPCNTIDVDPFQTFNLISGTASGSVRFLDLRRPSPAAAQRSHNAHTGAVTSSRFSPHLPGTFVTSSADATAVVWQQEAPVFVHGGHLLSVSDVVWCPSRPGVLASCSYDNSVHVWKPIL